MANGVETILEIVNSLTPAEKRLIKVDIVSKWSGSKESVYLKLFNLLDKGKALDQPTVIKKMQFKVNKY